MESKKDIKVNGKLTLEDYNNLNKIYMRNLFKKMIVLVFVAFLFMYGILFYKRYGGLFVGVASLLGTAFVYLSIFVVITIKVRKTFKNTSKNKFNYTYTVNKNGIHVQSETGGHQHFWKDVTESIKYKNIYILYVNKVHSILIPERFFKNPDSLDEFKNLVEKKTKISEVN